MPSPEDTEATMDMEFEERGRFWENLLTPEGLFMMGLAAFVDIVELVIDILSFFLAGVPEIISVILDIIALLVIGGWMFSRSGQVTVSEKAAARLQKLAKESERFQKFTAQASKWAKRIKWLAVLEMIPYVGAVPCWILAVYLELKYSPSFSES